ncbi:MAG: AAA family ATPase [Alphaproteobacteria bacterium]|nr:AAA family ATPase [Alphaproteobacteria bacterium]MBU1563452.1 AAA family ATPase [Alphaproteobacteria bacterium]
MGVRNYLIEGVSGNGKTTVAEELERRGCHVIHGDRTLAYLGDPDTGDALEPPELDSEMDRIRWRHGRWIWRVADVRRAVADQSTAQSFFCGGSRNHHQFIHLFDQVFVLDIDAGALNQRLASRPGDEFGGRPAERQLIARLHATKEDLPKTAVSIDAAAPIAEVVDEVLSRCGGGGEAR